MTSGLLGFTLVLGCFFSACFTYSRVSQYISHIFHFNRTDLPQPLHRYTLCTSMIRCGFTSSHFLSSFHATYWYFQSSSYLLLVIFVIFSTPLFFHFHLAGAQHLHILCIFPWSGSGPVGLVVWQSLVWFVLLLAWTWRPGLLQSPTCPQFGLCSMVYWGDYVFI